MDAVVKRTLAVRMSVLSVMLFMAVVGGAGRQVRGQRRLSL
jgi:hypothetical protein